MPRHVSVLLVAASLAWVAAILAGPYGLEFPYQLGRVICHQQPERSFWLAGRPLPVCARCTGLYVSASAAGLGVVAGATLRRRRALEPADRTDRRLRAPVVRRVLFVAALPTMATLAVEWLGIAQASSLARAVAAIPLGAAAGWVVTRVLREAGVD